MKIFVSVKTNAKEASVKKIDASHFALCVKEAPAEGKANAAVRRALADYFGIPLSSVMLLAGNTSKQKIFKIF